MAFISNKIINGKKYAYEITSKWDPESKKVKKTNKYLGIVDEDGSIIKKQDRKIKQAKALLDFGDVFLLEEFTKTTSLHSILTTESLATLPEILPLIFYRIAHPSAMYNAQNWSDGNVINLLYNNANLSSQNISRVLAALGDENLQRAFFTKYVQSVDSIETEKEGVIIDATSLPNEINCGFNAWGRSDGSIEKQFRFMCVVDRLSKLPLFYRFLPGNLVDVSTLQNTIAELKQLGVNNSFFLLDAGYCSEANIKDLYSNKIDFLTRLPADRTIYKELIATHFNEIEKASNAIRCNNRTLFVKKIETDLYKSKGYAYIVLDLVRKSKEVEKIFAGKQENTTTQELQNGFNNAGIMVLISSKSLAVNEVVETYYTRQSIEQIFGFFKSDLDSLPIRRHNDETVRGYLFLQFLALILFIQLREKLQGKFTAEQALLIMRNLKCKKFDTTTIINELTKKQKEITALCGVMVPKYLGI